MMFCFVLYLFMFRSGTQINLSVRLCSSALSSIISLHTAAPCYFCLWIIYYNTSHSLSSSSPLLVEYEDSRKALTQNQLCQHCNHNQSILISLFAEIDPDEDDKQHNYNFSDDNDEGDEENNTTLRKIRKRQQELESRYPLCEKCSKKVQQILYEQNRLLQNGLLRRLLERSKLTVEVNVY